MGLGGSFGFLDTSRVSYVEIAEEAGAAVSVVAVVVVVIAVAVAVAGAGAEEAAVAAAFEVVVVAFEAADPFEQHDFEQIPELNWPSLPLHPVRRKSEVLGAVAHRLVTSLVACLVQPFVDRALNFPGAFSPPPAFVYPPPLLH